MTYENLKTWLARNAAQPFADSWVTAEGRDALLSMFELDNGGDASSLWDANHVVTRERFRELVYSAERCAFTWLDEPERDAKRRLERAILADDEDEFDAVNDRGLTILGLFRARAELTDAPLVDIFSDEEIAAEDDLFCFTDDYGEPCCLADSDILDRAA